MLPPTMRELIFLTFLTPHSIFPKSLLHPAENNIELDLLDQRIFLRIS